MLEHVELWIARYGYAALFVLLMGGIFGMPVPDETLLALTGFLISQGKLHMGPAYLAAVLGSAAGITLSYGVGRFFGTSVLHRRRTIPHLRQEQLQRVEVWFRRWGRWLLFVGYFVPGFRHVTALVAGASGLPIGVFARFAYAGATLWVGVFIGLGYEVGGDWLHVLSEIQRPLYLGPALLAGAVFALLLVRWLVRRVRH